MKKIVLQRVALLAWLMLAETLFASNMLSLYSVKKGRKVGDIVTVFIVENAAAKNDASTRTDKAQNIKLGSSRGTGIMDVIPGLGLTGGSDFKFDGRGQTTRAGSLKATITARIVEVFDNGNVLIEGSKQVTLNEELEIIELSGIVRPEDIGSDNTVMSFNIADAVISYTGQGPGANAQRPSIFARILNWIF
jgi:flagellar L-ring protein FlgH